MKGRGSAGGERGERCHGHQAGAWMKQVGNQASSQVWEDPQARAGAAVPMVNAIRAPTWGRGRRRGRPRPWTAHRSSPADARTAVNSAVTSQRARSWRGEEKGVTKGRSVVGPHACSFRKSIASCQADGPSSETNPGSPGYQIALPGHRQP